MFSNIHCRRSTEFHNDQSPSGFICIVSDSSSKVVQPGVFNYLYVIHIVFILIYKQKTGILFTLRYELLF